MFKDAEGDVDELAHDSADDFHFGFTSGTKSRSEVAQRCVVFDGYLEQAYREPCAGSDCPLCLCLCCDALRCRFLRAVEPTPHRINDDPINHSKYHWFGTIGVAPNGRIDSVWMDTRNAANNTDSQLVYSYSTDGGVTWSPNVAVSQSFTPLAGWPNQNKIGDYITIVSDNTGGDVAYSATYNFSPSRGQHERDVYYVRVSPSGVPTPTPTVTATATASPTATPTATATPRPTPTPRAEATPRARPTPPRRP